MALRLCGFVALWGCGVVVVGLWGCEVVVVAGLWGCGVLVVVVGLWGCGVVVVGLIKKQDFLLKTHRYHIFTQPVALPEYFPLRLLINRGNLVGLGDGYTGAAGGGSACFDGADALGFGSLFGLALGPLGFGSFGSGSDGVAFLSP